MSTYEPRMIESVEPSPCQTTCCEHWKVCADEELACKAFLAYFLHGKFNGKPRIPKRKFYDRIFTGESVLEKA